MQAINSHLAPKAIGTYSQAIISGNTVYLAGQIPLDPQTMRLCSLDFKLQLTQVFENLSAVCQAAGGSLGDIVKLNVYLTDLANFEDVNDVMSKYFKEPFPARAAVQVAALPKKAQVEIDAIMVLKG